MAENTMRMPEFAGEMAGTFRLFLFGCGSVAVSVLFGSHSGLMQVVLAWGIGFMISVYLTRHLSCALLNPAVSLAMALSRRMPARKLLAYFTAQLACGALASQLFTRVLERQAKGRTGTGGRACLTPEKKWMES